MPTTRARALADRPQRLTRSQLSVDLKHLNDSGQAVSQSGPGTPTTPTTRATTPRTNQPTAEPTNEAIIAALMKAKVARTRARVLAKSENSQDMPTPVPTPPELAQESQPQAEEGAQDGGGDAETEGEEQVKAVPAKRTRGGAGKRKKAKTKTKSEVEADAQSPAAPTEQAPSPALPQPLPYPLPPHLQETGHTTQRAFPSPAPSPFPSATPNVASPLGTAIPPPVTGEDVDSSVPANQAENHNFDTGHPSPTAFLPPSGPSGTPREGAAPAPSTQPHMAPSTSPMPNGMGNGITLGSGGDTRRPQPPHLNLVDSSHIDHSGLTASVQRLAFGELANPQAATGQTAAGEETKMDEGEETPEEQVGEGGDATLNLVPTAAAVERGPDTALAAVTVAGLSNSWHGQPAPEPSFFGESSPEHPDPHTVASDMDVDEPPASAFPSAPFPSAPFPSAPIPSASVPFSPAVFGPIPRAPIPSTPVSSTPVLPAPSHFEHMPVERNPFQPNLFQPNPFQPNPFQPNPFLHIPADPLPTEPIPTEPIPAPAEWSTPSPPPTPTPAPLWSRQLLPPSRYLNPCCRGAVSEHMTKLRPAPTYAFYVTREMYDEASTWPGFDSSKFCVLSADTHEATQAVSQILLPIPTGGEIGGSNANANLVSGNGVGANGVNTNGFNTNAFNSYGFNTNAFNAYGFNTNGFNVNGFNTNTHNANTHNAAALDPNGPNPNPWNNLSAESLAILAGPTGPVSHTVNGAPFGGDLLLAGTDPAPNMSAYPDMDTYLAQLDRSAHSTLTDEEIDGLMARVREDAFTDARRAGQQS